MPRCDVAVLLAGLCLLGLLTGGCAALPGAEPTAYPPTMPSRISQAGGEATEPLPLNLTPRPSSTPEITPTPASTPVASTQHPPSDTPALAPSDTPTPTPTPSPTPTRTPSPPPATVTAKPSPQAPAATATQISPAASATPAATFPPTVAAVLTPASPTLVTHRFLPTGPVQPDPSHPCGCPRAPAYIVGRVTDAAGSPLTGVRLICYNEWHRYPVVASKPGGEYDFAITQAETTWYVVVVNAADAPLSPEIVVAFDPQECCRYLLDWRRVD